MHESDLKVSCYFFGVVISAPQALGKNLFTKGAVHGNFVDAVTGQGKFPHGGRSPKKDTPRPVKYDRGVSCVVFDS